MKTNTQRGYIVPIIIAIMILLVAGCIFWNWQSKSNQNLSEEQNSILANSVPGQWPTYTDAKYGFTLTFPESWKGYKYFVYSQPYDDSNTYAVYFGLADQGHVFGIDVMTKKDYADCRASELCPAIALLDDGKFVYADDGEGEIGQKVMSLAGADSVKEILASLKTASSSQSLPVITSITPSSGPIGTIVEIKGQNLSGFEGDLNVYFEGQDEREILLTDTFGDYSKTGSSLIKVKVKEPCQEGEKVIGSYSGMPQECNFVKLDPGEYKVYVRPWGKESNKVKFTITS